MIPGDDAGLKRMRELADRNIANGGWGEEAIPPGGDKPLLPNEFDAYIQVRAALGKSGSRKLPQKTT